ncbi:hypothetical protein B0A48_07381 [Cryoendolithus antarcticus]|uniref:Uncharacterized protein n=1 Tax=Cryoendolithus antarcticus TaxID=1507870 RepID=A0A1V8T8S8_9PEZI|nr:hypothetical protein B0A48_07381 [Cryoendolithus antarcticus]
MSHVGPDPIDRFIARVGHGFSRIKNARKKPEPWSAGTSLRSQSSVATMRSDLSTSQLQTRHNKRGAFTFFATGNLMFAHYIDLELRARPTALHFAPAAGNEYQRYQSLINSLWQSDSMNDEQKALWTAAAANIRQFINRGMISEEQVLANGGLVGWVQEYRGWARKAVDAFLAEKWMGEVEGEVSEEGSTVGVDDGEEGDDGANGLYEGSIRTALQRRRSGGLSAIDEEEEYEGSVAESVAGSVAESVAGSDRTVIARRSTWSMLQEAAAKTFGSGGDNDKRLTQRVSTIQPYEDSGFEREAIAALSQIWSEGNGEPMIEQRSRPVSPLSMSEYHAM